MEPQLELVVRMAVDDKMYTTAAYGEHSTAEKLVRAGYLERIGTKQVGKHLMMRYKPTQKAIDEFEVDEGATRPIVKRRMSK